MTKKNSLFILQLPPPIHGSSTMGDLIKKNLSNHEEFKIVFINSNNSKKISDIGRFNFYKILNYFNLILKVINNQIFTKNDFCYFSITSTGIAFFKDFLIGLILKFFNKKIVFHFHNKGISQYQDKIFYNYCYKFLFSNSSAIILSEHLRYDIKKYFDKSKIFILPNTISEQEEIILNLPEKSRVLQTSFLFLSNLIKSKGIFDLINACIHLKDKKYNFSVDIVGAEGDVKIVELNSILKSNNLENIIKIHGRKIGRYKEKFFLNSDVFIHPTKNDCFPLVLLEALKFSKPIISTDIGAIKDMVINNHNGFIIDHSKPLLIAKKMEFFIKNSSMVKKMSLNSRKLFLEKFNEKNFNDKLINILKRINEEN